ncbi:small GTP-binding protein [Yimella lutea]|uniref:Small GTP-binding protein n=1 Tax=Yimella lutea TaxID=587872 RepID=A0A542EIX4_9MICO|nr:GTPase [Yimella lutea]TQJ15292.1 small GTP-binding protein [Yimella lutea]
MNDNLFKESSATTRMLGDELRQLLREIDPAQGEPLLDRLAVEDHAVPLLVFTGYHSSGKSTLIEALTDRTFNVPIGSGVTTDSVTEYDWDGDVRLVDTPGVHAGRPHHDELAEQALQSADLVLFAVPVELFDDTLVAHLRDVLGRLGKSRQTLMVITKAGTMPTPAPGVREQAILEALGPFDKVPWVECDAQYYLDGLDLATSAPADSAAFIEASNLALVADRINGFARDHGTIGRVSQPLQQLLAISIEASASLVDDPDEQASLTVLARQRSALSKKRIHLDGQLEAQVAQFRGDAVRAATRFADAIETADDHGTVTDEKVQDEVADLNKQLRTALTSFESSVQDTLQAQFDDLASEVLEIEASPYGRVAVRLGDVQAEALGMDEVSVRAGSTTSQRSAPRWAGDLSEHLKKFHQMWGAGDGVKAASQSNGHKIVLSLGHTFGKKFKPWEAARTANTIGRAVKVGGAVIAVGSQLYDVYAGERDAVATERARAERRRNITQEVLAQADDISANALRTVRAGLDETLSPEFQRIDAMADAIHGARSTRSDHRSRLGSIQDGARAALARLAPDEVSAG